ncbi:MAG: (d)CMP kinase [Oscillospiraceae bacterium]
MIYSVALDGPSGAGKSTIAKEVAKIKGIVYVDTGALYRTIALFMIENQVDITDEKAVSEAVLKAEISLEYKDGTQCILLQGKDVSQKIRQNEVSMAASTVSAYKSVRAFLLDTQRNVAKNNCVIMDGRDIGTVVLPCANVKIFISAKSEIRAHRRHKELIEKGQEIDFEQVLKDIIQRDYNDINRKESPLKQAQDAVLIDTSEMSFQQSVAAVIEIIDKKIDSL